MRGEFSHLDLHLLLSTSKGWATRAICDLASRSLATVISAVASLSPTLVGRDARVVVEGRCVQEEMHSEIGTNSTIHMDGRFLNAN